MTRTLSIALLLVGTLGTLSACGREPSVQDSAAHLTAAAAPARVTTAPVTATLMPTGDEVVGTLRARNASEISASVMGTLRTLKVGLGSQVRAGEVLATLSAGEIEAKADRARAVLGQARIDLERAEQLKTSGSISPSAYDAAVAQFRVSEAARAEAEVMRGYTVLRAPFAGIITAKLAEVGDLAVPGKPLLVLESPGALRLEAAVPEAVAGRLRVGDHAAVSLDAVSEDLEGVVAEVSPSADPSSRTLLVKLDLPANPALRAGMFARVLVPTGTASRVLVPSDAIVRRGQMELAFVVEGQHARMRVVRAGRTQGGKTHVLAGLRPGERLVTVGAGALHDGQAVEVTP